MQTRNECVSNFSSFNMHASVEEDVNMNACK